MARTIPPEASVSEHSDNDFRIQNEADPTKEIDFDASGISTGTTRTLAMPDSDVTLVKNNFSATTAPNAATDDDTAGYTVGSRLIDVVAGKEYVCLDPSTGAAVWIETTQSGGSGSLTKSHIQVGDSDDSPEEMPTWMAKTHHTAMSIYANYGNYAASTITGYRDAQFFGGGGTLDVPGYGAYFIQGSAGTSYMFARHNVTTTDFDAIKGYRSRILAFSSIGASFTGASIVAGVAKDVPPAPPGALLGAEFIGFYFDESVSPNWFACCKSTNSTDGTNATVIDTTIAVSNTEPVDLLWEINPARTEVTFRINNTIRATINTDIPADATNAGYTFIISTPGSGNHGFGWREVHTITRSSPND